MRRPSNPTNPKPKKNGPSRLGPDYPPALAPAALFIEPEDDCDRAMHALFDTLRDWRKNPSSDLNQRFLAKAWDKYALELGKVVDEDIRKDDEARGITPNGGVD